jgi:hypothetical protein
MGASSHGHQIARLVIGSFFVTVMHGDFRRKVAAYQERVAGRVLLHHFLNAQPVLKDVAVRLVRVVSASYADVAICADADPAPPCWILLAINSC